MRITTWNVNGLRAVFNKDAFSWITQEKPEVVCFQEIKARPDQLTQEQLDMIEDGYTAYWNPAKRAGYSGVLTFSSTPWKASSSSLDEERFDSEGRLIRSDFDDFILFNVYFPNGKRDQERLDYKLDFYACLLEVCDQLHNQGKNIVICGDFNTAHQEIDLKNPKENEKVSGFLPEERDWITKYLGHGFVDVYRQLYPDRVQYTWWTYRFQARQRNIGWRLDYFLVSEKFVKRVVDVEINEDVLGSDHCPVTLTIDT